MLVFILESPEAAASSITASSLRSIPNADIRVLRPPFGARLNEHLAGCPEPFFMTLRAGAIASPALGERLGDWIRSWEHGCAGVVPEIRSNGGAGTLQPFLWRTEAVRARSYRSAHTDCPLDSDRRGVFPDYAWQPFDELTLADKMESLRSEWSFRPVCTNGVLAFAGSDSDRAAKGWVRRRERCHPDSFLPLLRSHDAEANDGEPPLVSVAICVYNESHYLPWAVRSVLGQTYRAWELLIVDDGSTDRPENALNGLERDRRVRFVRLNANLGKANALNAALEHARGRWLLELDADDWLEPGALASMAAAADQAASDTAMAYGDYAEWTESRARRLRFSGVRRFAGAWSVERNVREGIPLAPRLYRTEKVKAAGGWSVGSLYGGRLYEDMEMIDKLSGIGSIVHIPGLAYHRRLRPGSVTRRPGADYARWLNQSGR
ncbi:MAG: putative glycosyltransferase [Paenibacillus sp.]|nr:putative glycosyltransferase [Paenibacillus sp.]